TGVRIERSQSPVTIAMGRVAGVLRFWGYGESLVTRPPLNRRTSCLAAVLGLLTPGLFALVASSAFAQSENSCVRRTDKSEYAALAKVPEKARAKRNPLENDPDAVGAGRKLFEQHCAECHGMQAEGGKKGANLRAEEVQQATPGALFWILTNGVVRHGMP